ncbi:FliH/SctL family protein [Dyella sp.]|jgi:flagellar assembly protein FliH|uniref:FliH/SctL family protein n=1 Tax=Dyella sp. TaxID=1869338 RepID=UPI002D76DDC1|nr:FliH/SctL family protein [Dyella sp.]HET6433834.1 FliH/SctL family protein [Dyella sp.]
MAAQIIRDSFDGAERWELPAVGGVRAQAAPASELPPPPTVFELEALEQQARDEGFAAGHAEGLAAAERERRALAARMEALLNAAARPLATLDDATEQELARLATVIARRVVAHELALAPQRVVQAVQQAARALPAATRELRVRLHPDDLALLRELAVSEEHWQLLPDPALSRGDCLLESERSRLDGRVDTRLAAVVDAVLGTDEDDGSAEVTA